jgi:hypothetical protein
MTALTVLMEDVSAPGPDTLARQRTWQEVDAATHPSLTGQALRQAVADWWAVYCEYMAIWWDEPGWSLAWAAADPAFTRNGALEKLQVLLQDCLTVLSHGAAGMVAA